MLASLVGICGPHSVRTELVQLSGARRKLLEKVLDTFFTALSAPFETDR
jgi:hypothetical protein